MTNKKNWTNKQTLIALLLLEKYKDPKTLTKNNPVIIEIAKRIGRVPYALERKISNLYFARKDFQNINYDESSFGSNYSKLDQEIVTMFYNNPVEVIAKNFDKKLSKEFIPNDYSLLNIEKYIDVGFDDINKQKFLIVDQGTGSYNDKYIGHEIFNEKQNLLDSRFYVYVPSHNTLDIERLGANKKNTYTENIVVLFVKRINKNSTDRLITGMYPSAKVYSKPIPGEQLKRFLTDKDDKEKVAFYSIESDTYIEVTNDNLIIKTEEFNKYLFRDQYVYSNTYSDLDKLIYKYIEIILEEIEVINDTVYQDEIYKSNIATVEEIKRAPDKKIELQSSSKGKSVKRNSSLAKAAIDKVNYQCEVDPTHRTFLNKSNMPYMEGHHLIPLTVNNAIFYEKQFNKNIDCLENIVSLCPNCHKAIHLGNNEFKKEIIEILYHQKLSGLEKIGIKISLAELLDLYKIKWKLKDKKGKQLTIHERWAMDDLPTFTKNDDNKNI